MRARHVLQEALGNCALWGAVSVGLIMFAWGPCFRVLKTVLEAINNV